MSNSKELLASFYQKTITKEWDVVIAYDRERANALLEQEYIQKVLSGEGHFPAINWKSKDGYYSFSNLTIGKPLISFEDSDVTSSIIIATLPFISGSVVEFDSNNTVIALTEITEVNDFKIKLRINLSEGQGEVNSAQGVVIKFKQGTLLDLSLPINIHAEVNYFFEQLLKNSDVEYQLGTVNTGTNEIFMPREFIIRTQPAPGARVRGAKNYGHGAILIFIMTNYSAKGTQGEAPKSDFPYIIPNDATATYIISNQVFFDGYLQQELKNILGDGLITKFEKINKNDAMSASKLNIFMSDFKSLVWVDFVAPSTDPMMNFPTRLMHHVHNEITSLNYLYLVIDELSLSPNDFGESYGILSSLRNGGIHINHKFTYIKWKHSIIGPIQERLNYDGIKFTKGDIVNHKPIITNDGLIKLPEKIMVSDVIEFTGDKVPNEFSSHITNYSKYVNKEVSKWFDFKISDINTTLFSSILFSEKNTLHFKSASITGDLVLFGDVAPVLTAFQITPLQTVLALKDSLLFSLSSDHAVIWSISPAESGTIDANTGLYTAPDKLPLENHLVTVTATDAKGQQASALIKLEASSVVIPARFNIIREKNKEQIQLVTSVISQSAEETINWIISDASNSNSGSVSQTGLYTPPEEEFEKGHTFITVTAKVASGSKGNSIVCLIGNNTLEMFQPTPSGMVSIYAGEQITFEAIENDDFAPDTWDIYPEVGDLSDVSITPALTRDENDKYSVVYTAPKNIEQSEFVMIRSYPKKKEKYAGYTLIEIKPAN